MLAKSRCFDERWGIRRFGEAACSPARTLTGFCLPQNITTNAIFRPVPNWPC